MSTLNENLTRLSTAKDNIATAIVNKGGTVGEYDGFEDFSTDISTIPTVSSEDNGKVVVNGVLTNQTNRTITSNGTYNTTTNKQCTVNVPTNNLKLYAGIARPCITPYTNHYWVSKTWNGLTNFQGQYVWSDGTNIYYSMNSMQYVLNKSTSTWTAKTWSGYSYIDGRYIWSDDTNIYYSSGNDQCVLNKSTSTWTTKSWNRPGGYSFSGIYVWTDGTNIYSSNRESDGNGILTNNNWYSVTFGGNYYRIGGSDVWTNGINCYSRVGDTTYIFDKSTKTWSSTSDFTNVNGSVDASSVWSDGINMYYTYRPGYSDSGSYILSGNNWYTMSDNLESLIPSNKAILGNRIWTDGTDIYYSDDTYQYVLNTTKTTPPTKLHTPSAKP